IRVDVGDETSVDLDDVERQRAKVRERRESGPEIVERQANALVLQARDDGPRKIKVCEERTFGDFNHEPLGRKGAFREYSNDALRQPAVRELKRRNVDGNANVLIPGGGFAKRIA